MKNANLEHLNSAEREEYLEIINSLKKEFKDKIQAEIVKVREQLSKNTAEILGLEFANLLNERKQMMQDFKASGKQLLLRAKELGLYEELKKLEDWSTQSKKDEKARPEGTKLFENLINSVSLHNSPIANEVHDIQAQLAQNSTQLLKIIKDKKGLIDKAQNDCRAPLQKAIVDLLLEFNKKIAVVNKSFNVELKKALSPFDDGDKSSIDTQLSPQITTDFADDLSEDIDDEMFIPLSGSDDNLN